MSDHTLTTLDLSALPLEPGDPLIFEQEVRLPPMRLAGQDYGFVPDMVTAVLKVIDVGRGYTVNMSFSCRLEGACWRCLEPADLDLDVTVEDFFEAELPPIEELGEEDEPTLWYQEDGMLNLSDWARDAVAELLPPKILCQPACRGLCPQCGGNRNLTECGCEPPADFRWEKLKDWKPEAD
ncbi:MAG: DUF177 domain-containing protein [Thermoleophilia bacterium]|nr:DUF177 domain-containing protein [Thermoleophilia bacterium]